MLKGAPKTVSIFFKAKIRGTGTRQYLSQSPGMTENSCRSIALALA